MNTNDLYGRTDSDALNYCSTLEDIDMDLLVGTSFNKVALREPMRDVEPRQMPVDDLDQDPTVLQPQSFLSNDILGEFSPRNISDDRELPLEKEGFVPFLCDDGEVEEIEGLNEFRPPADMLADAITVTAEPIDPQQLPLEQLISIPGSIMLDDELEAFESSPLAPDNAWQENAPFSVCTQLETTPLSPTNQAILLPLEEDKHQFNHQPFSLTQHMLGVEQVFRPNASAEDIYSRPLQADSSPSKPSRKIGRHLKKGTSQGAKTREEPHLRPPAAQKVLKKKTSGRRKVGHFCLR